MYKNIAIQKYLTKHTNFTQSTFMIKELRYYAKNIVAHEKVCTVLYFKAKMVYENNSEVEH